MHAKIILLIIRLFSRLPLSTAQLLGGLLGWLMYLLPNREKHVARVNITHCFPKLSPAEQDRLLKKGLIESAKGIVEMPGIWFGKHKRWIERVEIGTGKGLFEEALAQDKGVIVAGPHQGNWDLTLLYLATLSPVTALFKPPKYEELNEILKMGRSQTGAHLVSTSALGVKELFGSLRKKQVAGILCDQEPKVGGKQGGVFAPFFGKPAFSMILLNRFARKTGAPVLFLYTERLPRGKGFRAHWFKAPPEIADEDPIVGAEAMNRALETCIRHCPSQYLWSYKRFQTQPEGKSRLY